PEICSLANLCSTGLGDFGQGIADVHHLECKVAKAGFVDPWRVTMMHNPVLVNFQKGSFKVRKFEPNCAYFEVCNPASSGNVFTGQCLEFAKFNAPHDFHIERCKCLRISGYQIDVSKLHEFSLPGF